MFAGKWFRASRGIVARGFGFVSALAGSAVLGRKKARFAMVQLAVGLMVAVAAQAAFAATYIWTTTGGGDGITWESGNNWNPANPSWTSTSTIAAYINSPNVTPTLNVSNSAAMVAFGPSAYGDTFASNAGGVLVLGTSGVNASTLTGGTAAISATINENAGGTHNWYGPTSSSGTLVFAGSDTTNQAWIFNSGNLIISGGTLNNTSSYLMFNKTANPSNILQTGGLVQAARSANNSIYLSQGNSACNYTISGGSAIVTPTNALFAVAYGSGSNPNQVVTLAISGNAFVKTPKLCPEDNNSAGNGTVNMQGGLLLTDEIFDQAANAGGFNFSGGTIQPIDGGTVASTGFGGLTGDFIGHTTAADNFNMPITGSAATIDTTDASGNPQTVTLYANVSGAGTLTAIGGGTLSWSGSSTSNYSGQININSGTVRVANSNPFTSGIVNVNGGVLDLAGKTPTVGTVTLTSGSIGDSVGGGSITATGLPSFALQSGTVSAVLAGPSATLAKTTAGAVNLTSANTYGGLTTISAGTLALIYPSGSLGTGNVTITPGAVLDTSSYDANSAPPPTLFGASGGTLSAGRTGTPGTDINGSVALQGATINIPTGGTLTVGGNLSFSSGNETYLYAPGDLINTTTGGVSFNSTTSVFPTGGSIATGTYTLFTYGGADPNISDLQMASSFQSGTRQTYVFSATNGAVTLSVSGAPSANLLWNVAGSGLWDVTTSKNWYNTGTSATDFFYNADNVTFNDRPGGGSVSVVVNGTVLPGSIIVSNTNVAYTFSNADGGQINGSGSLIKSGTGTLTINTANGYQGGTTLYAGLLNLGNASALGAGALTINGGSLDNTVGSSMMLANNIAQNWDSSFTFKGTSALNLGGGAVTLGTTPTVTVSSSTLTVGGPISGPYGLNLSGPGMLVLGNASNSYTGDTTISSGVLQAGIADPLPYGIGNGNLVFSGSVQPAVLDLNGNNVAINGLSQPSVTSQTTVVNNMGYSLAVLSVGNNNNTTTFGGILADNSNPSGGTLALTLAGGALTLVNTNTYSGATTISGGSLLLGTGAAGQDGQLAYTTSIVSSGALVVNNTGPTTLVPINASSSVLSGVLVQNSASTLTLTGQNYLSSLVVNKTGITGGTINLNGGNSFTNAAPGEWTLSSPLNFPGTGSIFWIGGSGTLDIEAPVTDSTGHFYTNGGNYVLGNSGEISVSGYARVMNDLGGSTVNFLQTGGSINLYRNSFSLSSLYISQAGTTNYTMTGGTIQIPYLTHMAYGTGSVANLTINGPTAVFQGTEIDLNDGTNGSGGSGVINLVSGALQTDDVFLSGNSQGFGSFNFSGGTLQPIDNGAVDQNHFLGFGNSSGSLNFTITLSGSAAIISSTDASGNPQTVPVYAVLGGTGGVNLAGAGTIVLNGTNTFSGGAVVASGGTVQVGNNAAFGTGTVNVEGTVDLAGFSPTVGALTGNSFALITNSSGTNSTLTVSPSGTTTTYAGTIADGPTNTTALTLTGTGTLYLTGTNTYSGGTTVSGDAELIVTNLDGILGPDANNVNNPPGVTNLYVGNYSFPFGTIQPTATPAGAVAPVPEPGTLALLAACGAAAAVAVRRRPQAGTRRVRPLGV